MLRLFRRPDALQSVEQIYFAPDVAAVWRCQYESGRVEYEVETPDGTRRLKARRDKAHVRQRALAEAKAAARAHGFPEM